MSQGGYTQTILLDANRLSSEEYSASNLAESDTAIFTNKVSNGITIDIGDQVSIQSAHIAQRGAGGSVIQMNGDEIGETTISETIINNSSFVGFQTDPVLDITYSVTGYAYETSENVDKKVKVKDNKASVIFEYYKNTNGENCIGLPRNFGSASMGKSVHGGDPSGAGVTNAEFWNASDSFAKGLNTYPVTGSHLYLPDWKLQQAINCCGSPAEVRKIKHDNSKFTIFRRSEVVHKFDDVSSASNASYLEPTNTGAKPDPCLGTYNRFRQRVDLEVDKGYNSPSSISTEITDKLIQTTAPLTKVEGAVVVNGTLYRTFECASYQFFNASYNQNFFNAPLSDHLPVGVGTHSVNNESSTLYLNNYTNVGFKRPDLVESGRDAFAYHGSTLTESIPLSSSGVAIIKTEISWNDAVLSRIKKFFDSQRLYPELLNYATQVGAGTTNYESFNTTSASLNASFREEARFLHLQISGSGTRSGTDPLGGDNYNVSYSSATLSSVRANASDESSIPVFVYFNNNCSHLTTSDTIGDTNDNLAYGFARKIGNRVGFVTEPIGGIPSSYFTEHAGNQIDSSKAKIGYDYHFNAYGNAAILLSSGFHPLQYYGHQSFTNAPFVREVYLGANNILFNFNTAESRFEISNLHSSEKVGNFYNAGDPNPPNNIFAPPPAGQAGNDVYKINKAMKYDTWTPDLQPYSDIDTTGSYTGGTQNTFIELNRMIESATIYDAHGGVSIVDMGIPEEMWDKSIWGLLGFEYGQFNASGNIEDIENINIRFTNDTTNTSGITTNADVTSENSLEFSVNVFGTNLFNPNLESGVRYYETAQVINSFIGSASYVVQPAIVVNAESTKITANKLPRKLLRGYFLINSDILDTANYYQLANPLQTMAIVGKYQGNNDFISYDGGGAKFTATRKKTITSIKTQILDPEGGTAQVGDNSGVIYKIDKVINTDLKFAETLMSQMNSKK